MTDKCIPFADRSSWQATYNAVLVDALKSRGFDRACEYAISIANQSESVLDGKRSATGEAQAIEQRSTKLAEAALAAEHVAWQRLRALVDSLFEVSTNATEIEREGTEAARAKLCTTIDTALNIASGPFVHRLAKLAHEPYSFVW